MLTARVLVRQVVRRECAQGGVSAQGYAHCGSGRTEPIGATDGVTARAQGLYDVGLLRERARPCVPRKTDLVVGWLGLAGASATCHDCPV